MVNNLTWTVKYHNCNSDKICDYDILKYETDFIRKLKKKANGDKEYFAKELRSHMQYHYWSKCEWEIIISKNNDVVILSPWISRNPEAVSISVDNSTFDWTGFADEHIYPGKYEAKIDVFDQIVYRWDEFVDYCWNTRLKYERVKKQYES